jgi:hypothetical protein
MTTSAKAADNGSSISEKTSGIAGQPDRITGMAQVREAETYQAASVMNLAISEAERLCGQVYHAISDAYFKDVRHTSADDNGGRTAAQTAESPEIQGKATEALNCLYAAEQYVRRLLAGSEPPF